MVALPPNNSPPAIASRRIVRREAGLFMTSVGLSHSSDLGQRGTLDGVLGGAPGAHMLHLNQKAKRFSCRGGKYATTDVLGFLRFDPSPEICSQTSSYSTSHWAHAIQQRWCIELRLHQIVQKSIRNRYLKVTPFKPPFKTILETNILT